MIGDVWGWFTDPATYSGEDGLWNRLLEQSWFFPWYDVSNDSRMLVAHADAGRVHSMLLELLDAGGVERRPARGAHRVVAHVFDTAGDNDVVSPEGDAAGRDRHDPRRARTVGPGPGRSWRASCRSRGL